MKTLLSKCGAALDQALPWLILFLIWLMLAPEAPAQELPPPEPTGSPEWFDGGEFFSGWATSWVIFGPMYIYWKMKKSVNDAIE